MYSLVKFQIYNIVLFNFTHHDVKTNSREPSHLPIFIGFFFFLSLCMKYTHIYTYRYVFKYILLCLEKVFSLIIKFRNLMVKTSTRSTLWESSKKQTERTTRTKASITDYNISKVSFITIGIWIS